MKHAVTKTYRFNHAFVQTHEHIEHGQTTVPQSTIINLDIVDIADSSMLDAKCCSIDAQTLPRSPAVRSLPCNMSVVKFASSPRLGISPVRALFDKSKCVKEETRPSSDGISPEIWLLERSINVSLDNFDQSLMTAEGCSFSK